MDIIRERRAESDKMVPDGKSGASVVACSMWL